MISKRFKCLIIVILYLLSACSSKNGPANSNSTSQASSAGQSSPTSEVVIPTNIPEASSTPTIPPTATFTPEPALTEPPAIISTPVPAVPECINRATLVRHLSFGDNSTIFNGLFFVKAWRLQNTGTCIWTTAYAFVFASGEQMDGPAETHLSHDVPPGDTIDIQILMEAPFVANAYTGNWMLRDPNGLLFGTGETSDQPITINLVVKFYDSTAKDNNRFNTGCGG